MSANDGVARSGTITVTGAGIVRTFKVVQSAWVDPYEPDDSPSAAKLITKGVLQNRSIHKVGNADWARFKVGGGGALNLQIETSGPVGDTHMWLIRSDGTRQAYDNDGGTGSRDSRSSMRSSRTSGPSAPVAVVPAPRCS